MNRITGIDAFLALVDTSVELSVVVFKHSTRCPVSAWAHQQMETLDVPVHKVLVIEDRTLSNFIEKHSGVLHESPQVIVFKNRMPVLTASHYEISRESILKHTAK